MDRDKYDRAIEATSALMRQEFGQDLLGMLLAGSVAYGYPYKRSDLDIYVIIRPSWRQRRTRFVEGVEVELFINPPAQIRKEFNDALHSTLAMFAQGRVLHDPHGLIAELAAEAKQAWAQPGPEITPEALLFLRYSLTDLLKDAQDLAETNDEEAATYMGFTTLRTSLEAHYNLQRRRPPKPKHLLRDLHARSPDIEQMVRGILSPGITLEERCARLAALVERVLEPVGGQVGEWETTPEVVPPNTSGLQSSGR